MQQVQFSLVRMNDMLRKAKMLCLLLATASILLGAADLSYVQLRQFIRSSVDQKLKDKEVANYLKSQSVQFAITDRLIEEFVGWGIGTKTLAALEALQLASSNFQEPIIEPVVEKKPKQPPPPHPAIQQRILEEARLNSRDYTAELPNYLCLQVTRRFYDPSGLSMDWFKHDEIKTRVTYFDGVEDYETISVNDRTTNQAFQELGGATSTGEFGTILDSLFAITTAAEFSWARHSLLRGRNVYVFHLEVPVNRSSWTLTSANGPQDKAIQSIRAGYKGLVYIDKETNRVLRIVMEAEGIPWSFPMQEAKSRLDFDFIDVSDSTYLLPLKAQTFIRNERLLSRNEIEFRLYRKFTTESMITFEEMEELEPLAEDYLEP